MSRPVPRAAPFATAAAIDQELAAAVAKGAAAGLVAMAADAGGTLYEGAFGERQLGAGVPMTTDTVFHIASMTKALVAAAAMQLVEQGRISLDEPLGRYAPQLAAPMVVEGFAADGAPILRPARSQITLRQLLTHSSGFAYELWNPKMDRYMKATALPAGRTGRLAALDVALAFDPGSDWGYGIGIDWAGQVIERESGQDLDRYMRENLFGPLGMRDTGFLLDAEQCARGAGMHWRGAAGPLVEAAPFAAPERREFFAGGGGLCSTAPDYMRFQRMILNGGALDGARVLKADTVAAMVRNQLGGLDVRPMPSTDPALSFDCDLFGGMRRKWGLSFMITTEDVPGRRRAGSLAWAGLRNTYNWIDPAAGLCGVLMTQSVPFADPQVLATLDAFEAAVYATFAPLPADMEPEGRGGRA